MDPLPRPPLLSYEEVARLFDCTILEPERTNRQVVDALEAARRCGVASATVRPCDIDLAVRTLQGSAVKPASVCGYPQGIQNTATKLYELRDLLRRGAKEIDLVIAIPSLRSREFQYVQTELLQAAEACIKANAILKVVLGAGYLDDELKIIACRCCETAGVDFVAASTGFGPAVNEIEEAKFLRKYLPEEIGVKGAAERLDDVLALYDAGCSRIASAGPAALLSEWRARRAPAATS
jgi:deoxyribose-phosphate aldolase